MADYRSEDPDGGFKKTFVAIAVVHLVLLGGLLLATLFQSKKNSDTVVWMSPGSFGGDSASRNRRPLLERSLRRRRTKNHDRTTASTKPKRIRKKRVRKRKHPQPTPPPAPSTPPPVVEQSELPIPSPTPTPTPSRNSDAATDGRANS